MEDKKINNLLNEIMNILKNELNVNTAIVRRLENDKLIKAGTYGYNKNEISEVKELREGISGLSACKNITIVVNDLEIYNNVYFKGINTVKSTVAVPILFNDKVIGTFNVASNLKNNFDRNKIEIIEKISNIFKNALVGFPDFGIIFLKNFIMKNSRKLYDY